MIKLGATRISDIIELLPTKYTIPKTSSNKQSSATFEKIAEALNSPKLQEVFLNGNKENEILNEIVVIFDKRTTVHPPRVLKCGMETPKEKSACTSKGGKPLCAGRNKT